MASLAFCVALLALMICQHQVLASFHLLGTGCVDRGVQYHPDQIWYHDDQCVRYGCFNPDNPTTYKVTCPEYPIPDCPYRLVTSPDAPFPNCCVRPVCV